VLGFSLTRVCIMTVQWMIRNTFIELQESDVQWVPVRRRIMSDFDITYSSDAVNLMDKADEFELESERSTSIGSWAEESDNERESVIADCTEHAQNFPSTAAACCLPALQMMPFVVPSLPASPLRAQEAPILPKPVQEQKVKKGEVRTTVMIRNMPNNYTRKMLLELLDLHGFHGCYDFVYLPIDFETKACLGYAFINMCSPAAANQFWAVFDGFSSWAIPSRKVSGVSWSGPHQGLDAHIERYRNSSIMCDTTPDDYKPIILSNGVRIPFPAATRRLRSSRQSRR